MQRYAFKHTSIAPSTSCLSDSINFDQYVEGSQLLAVRRANKKQIPFSLSLVASSGKFVQINKKKFFLANREYMYSCIYLCIVVCMHVKRQVMTLSCNFSRYVKLLATCLPLYILRSCSQYKSVINHECRHSVMRHKIHFFLIYDLYSTLIVDFDQLRIIFNFINLCTLILFRNCPANTLSSSHIWEIW